MPVRRITLPHHQKQKTGKLCNCTIYHEPLQEPYQKNSGTQSQPTKRKAKAGFRKHAQYTVKNREHGIQKMAKLKGKIHKKWRKV